jgi:hypothetical protein
MRIVIDTDSEDYDERMEAARERAEWELGDRSWASVIVGAFLYPKADNDNLKREIDE